MSNYPYWRGTIYGAVAYLCGLASSWLYISWGQTVQAAVAVSQEQWAVWYYYSANFVSVVEGISGGGSSSMSMGGADLISQAGDPHFQILYLFPWLFCAGAGILLNVGLSRSRGGPILRGAWIALGYALSMLVGAFIFSIRESGFGLTVRLGPSYAEALIMGLLISALAGAFGGLLYKIAEV